MEWFRFYHEVVDDPKVQRLSPILFKHWVNILCLSSRNSDRGSVPASADLAFGLRLSETKVRSICADLVDAGLLERDAETLRVHGWMKRQKRSDDVTARVNKHRYGNEMETLHETLQVTEDETLPRVRVKNRTEENRTEEIENPPPPKPKPKHRLPEDWQPLDRHREKLADDGYSTVEINAEAEKFKNHHRHKGDFGLEWDRSFLNWMANVPNFTKANTKVSPNGKGRPPDPFSPEHAAYERAERIRLGWDKPEGKTA